jgi:phosphoglucomutase
MIGRKVDALAGKPAPAALLVDVPRLITAYYAERPDPAAAGERVAFGTSGHRGSSLTRSFNEAHILAITQAICAYRKTQGIDGPLFLGWDTHALSEPARVTALEVLAANGVEVAIDSRDAPTPTPVVSHAILSHNNNNGNSNSNRGRRADGIVVTPSHNPPQYGGFKYNPPSGGPAASDVTAWIEREANALLASGIQGVARVSYERARMAPTTKRYDYRTAYVSDLDHVIDAAVLRSAKLRLGVDPLGGASLEYWGTIAERYHLDLDIVNPLVDPTFRFMTVDWDGAIRMDPSSPYAMARLIELRNRYDLAFAADPDADRHGIVCRSGGLLPPNHYLSVAIDYLFRHRPGWSPRAGVGKTIVSSSLLDRVAARLGRKLVEVPVGFKSFVDGLLDGSLGFAGEESAGASFLRTDGTTWTTDKDGLAPGLLAVEITARLGRDPGEIYREMTRELGDPAYERVDFDSSSERKEILRTSSPADLRLAELAGEPVTAIVTTASGNGRPIDGIKVATANAWFAARPSGTEPISKLYAESFKGPDHLARVQEEAQAALETLFRARGAK